MGKDGIVAALPLASGLIGNSTHRALRRSAGRFAGQPARAITIASALLLCGNQTCHAQKSPLGGSTQPIAPITKVGLSPTAMTQIATLLTDRAAQSAAERKMDAHLVYAARKASKIAITSAISDLPTHITPDSNGRVEVDVYGTVTDSLTGYITALNGVVTSALPEYGNIHAHIPLTALTSIAARDDVSSIRRFIPPIHASARAPRRAFAPYRKYHRTPEELNAMIQERIGAYLGTNPFLTLSSLFLAGNTTFEGDVVHQMNTARTNYGISGAGIRVGVLSDDDLNLTKAIKNGNLPAQIAASASGPGVTILSGQSGSNDGGETGEGTAMMEVIYHSCPSAHIFFATAALGEAQFATNITSLRSSPNNCDIILDDEYYFDEPPFQDGIVADAVDTVTSSGALYFSAAGNQGHLNTTGNNLQLTQYGYPTNVTESVWEGDFANDGTVITSPTLSSPDQSGGGTIVGYVHEYNSNGSAVYYNTINADAVNGGSNYVALSWSDPQGGSSNNYNLFVTSSDGSSVYDYGDDPQTGTQNPYQLCEDDAAGQRIYVVASTTAQKRALHIDTFGDGYNQDMTFVTNGNTHGHSSAANAMSVAAAPATSDTDFYGVSAGGPYPSPFSSSSPVELFSSDGLRRIFYTPSGTPITPGNLLFSTNGGEVLQKPNITAADGVHVGAEFSSSSGLNPFYGTSCATPHAGAVACLLKSYSDSGDASHPGLTINGYNLSVSEMAAVLENTAIDIASPGVDNVTGYGIVMPLPAIQYLQSFVTVGTITAVPTGPTTATVSWTTELPSTSVVNYGATTALGSTVTGSSGVTSHSVSLTGLTPGTEYYYQISSTTPTSSLSYTLPVSTNYTFTTGPTPPPAGQAVLNITGISLSTTSGVTTAQITIANSGTATANSVQITSALLGSAGTTTPTPVSAGSIANGASAVVSVSFVSPGSGTKTTIRIVGSDAGGDSFSYSGRVTVP